MAWFESHLLSVLVFFPLFWGAVIFLLPNHRFFGARFQQIWTLMGSLLVFVLSVIIYSKFDNTLGFQLIEKHEWIKGLGVSYFLAIDGLSVWLILLTTFLTPLVVLSSFAAITERTKAYYFLLLFLETGMLGAFVALDLFLFYIFWEAMLIPMYFLIGIWGGKDRIYAAMKFFIYTLSGSLLMLVAIFFLAYQYKIQNGVFSTSLIDLYRVQLPSLGGWNSTQGLCFLAFAIAFAIKVPLFPLHTWLPDAHVQAPTAGSVILAGVLLKMGGYGFVRFAFPLFPDAVIVYQNTFLILGGIAIVYGACVAMVQPDIKKLVAYSSVSHMGYVVVGLFSLNAIGVTGALYQMLNHGVSTGALFLMVGMLYERRHTREISEFGGIGHVMPLFSVVLLIVTLSSIALPGTNGFVGEFLILLGAWQTKPVIAVVSGLGVILGAVYMLWVYQRVIFGKIKKPENQKLIDLNLREWTVLIPLVVAIFAMGFLANPILKDMSVAVQSLVEKKSH